MLKSARHGFIEGSTRAIFGNRFSKTRLMMSILKISRLLSMAATLVVFSACNNSTGAASNPIASQGLRTQTSNAGNNNGAQPSSPIMFGSLKDVSMAVCTGSNGDYLRLDQKTGQVSIQIEGRRLENFDVHGNRVNIDYGDSAAIDFGIVSDYYSILDSADDADTGQFFGLTASQNQTLGTSQSLLVFENENGWEGTSIGEMMACQLQFSPPAPPTPPAPPPPDDFQDCPPMTGAIVIPTPGAVPSLLPPPTDGDGMIIWKNNSDAAAYCSKQKAQVPTARELAEIAIKHGAKGIAEIKSGKPDASYQLVCGQNVNDGTVDQFYYSSNGFHDDEMAYEVLWTQTWNKRGAYGLNGNGQIQIADFIEGSENLVISCVLRP
jgi:hypothetical protein